MGLTEIIGGIIMCVLTTAIGWVYKNIGKIKEWSIRSQENINNNSGSIAKLEEKIDRLEDKISNMESRTATLEERTDKRVAITEAESSNNKPSGGSSSKKS